MTDYRGAIALYNSNCFVGSDGQQKRWITLHATAGGTSAQAIAEYFQSTTGSANPVSANYIVDQQAVIIQCNSELDGAWANGFISGPAGVSGNGIGNGYHDAWWDTIGNPNNSTISIECVKASTDNSDPLTPAQKCALFALIADICQRHKIPLRKADASGGITGHYSIDPVNRQFCPNTFPWPDLWNLAGGEETITLTIATANGFFVDISPQNAPSTMWHCLKNGCSIGNAILQYYRTCTNSNLNGVSQFGLPLTNEQPDKVPGTTYQLFERGVICYDPNHKNDSAVGVSGPCYPGHVATYIKANTIPANVLTQISSVVQTMQSLESTLTTLTK